MTANPSNIACVCFDWGGVILRICRGFEEGVAAAGLKLRDGSTNPELYTVRQGISADYQVGKIDDTAFFNAISDSMQALYTPAELALIHDAWLIEEYPGVAQLIKDLHNKTNLAAAMLSNTNARHWARRLADFPAAGTLHHQHASHELGAVKPDPAIFKSFERKTGFKPGQILFFDDLQANITAAREAGWHAEQIDHTADTAAQMRTHLQARNLL